MLRKDPNLLDTLASEFQELITGVDDLVRRTDPAQLNRRPADGGWSAAECIDHLNVSARLYLEPLQEAIAEARRVGRIGNRPDGRTLFGRLVAWTMEPPPRFTMKTYGALEPGTELAPEALAREFETLHRTLIAELESAAGLDRKRVKVRSLLERRLKLSLDDWFAFIAAHARRHLWQAERALERVAGAGPDEQAQPN